MAVWVKPTLETRLHIDFDWWKDKDRNFRVVLQSRLCDSCREQFASAGNVGEIDWVDPDTAEVTRVDGLWHSLRTCCSQKPGYITDKTPLTEAAFRIFLANNNTPLTPVELHQIIERKTPKTILSALTGKHIYMGIKPIISQQPKGKAKK